MSSASTVVPLERPRPGCVKRRLGLPCRLSWVVLLKLNICVRVFSSRLSGVAVRIRRHAPSAYLVASVELLHTCIEQASSS